MFPFLFIGSFVVSRLRRRTALSLSNDCARLARARAWLAAAPRLLLFEEVPDAKVASRRKNSLEILRCFKVQLDGER